MMAVGEHVKRSPNLGPVGLVLDHVDGVHVVWVAGDVKLWRTAYGTLSPLTSILGAERESASVACSTCTRPTWNYGGRCDGCILSDHHDRTLHP